MLVLPNQPRAHQASTLAELPGTAASAGIQVSEQALLVVVRVRAQASGNSGALT